MSLDRFAALVQLVGGLIALFCASMALYHARQCRKWAQAQSAKSLVNGCSLHRRETAPPQEGAQ